MHSLQVWLAQVPAWWEVEFALRTEVPNSSTEVQFFCPVSRFYKLQTACQAQARPRRKRHDYTCTFRDVVAAIPSATRRFEDDLASPVPFTPYYYIISRKCTVATGP